MKNILIFLLLFFSFKTMALEQSFLIQQITESDLDRAFILKTANDNIVFDCHSFIQGITVINNQGRNFLLLEPNECESHLLQIIELFAKEKQICLNLNWETLQLHYSADILNCKSYLANERHSLINALVISKKSL